MAPTPDSVRVQPNELFQHAACIAALAATVEVARDAAHTVAFDTHAYGVFCQALPAMMQPLQSLITTTVANTGSALFDLSERVRTAGTAYQEADEAAAARLRDPR